MNSQGQSSLPEHRAPDSSAFSVSGITNSTDDSFSDLAFYYKPPQEQSIAELPAEVEEILQDCDIDPDYVVAEVNRVKAQLSQGGIAKISSLTFAALAGYQFIVDGTSLSTLSPSVPLTAAALGAGCYALGSALQFGANRRLERLREGIADARESILAYAERSAKEQ
jgi:hypothetical protein